jgi:hypothetical protein
MVVSPRIRSCSTGVTVRVAVVVVRVVTVVVMVAAALTVAVAVGVVVVVVGKRIFCSACKLSCHLFCHFCHVLPFLYGAECSCNLNGTIFAHSFIFEWGKFDTIH